MPDNPKWRSKSDPSVVVELMRRDATDVMYKQGGATQFAAIEDFDKAFEPVLPTVKLSSQPQPTGSVSRTADDGTPIPATPAPGNQVMNGIGLLLDEVYGVRDQVAKLREQVAAIYKIVVPQPAPPATVPPTPPPPADKTG
jgi:hypothetical protein